MNTRKISKGYALRPGVSEFHHHFGGRHSIQGAGCPNCSQQLILHFSIDCADPRLGLQDLGIAVLPLLYCMRCELCWYDFVYQIEAEDSIRILKFHQGSITGEWAAEMGINEFPLRNAELVQVPRKVEEYFDRLNADEDLTDEEEAEIAEFTKNYANPEVGGYPIVDVINQIGGRSFLSQRLDDPTCEGCKNPMFFLASLTNDLSCGLKFSFDSVQIVFFLCQDCRRIHAQHSM